MTLKPIAGKSDSNNQIAPDWEKKAWNQRDFWKQKNIQPIKLLETDIWSKIIWWNLAHSRNFLVQTPAKVSIWQKRQIKNNFILILTKRKMVYCTSLWRAIFQWLRENKRLNRNRISYGKFHSNTVPWNHENVKFCPYNVLSLRDSTEPSFAVPK